MIGEYHWWPVVLALSCGLAPIAGTALLMRAIYGGRFGDFVLFPGDNDDQPRGAGARREA